MSLMSQKLSIIKTEITPKFWFVLYTRPNFEKWVDKNLREVGFHTYLPVRKELRHWNDRTTWIEIPLFRSYVFIKTSSNKKNLAFQVGGIVKYVSIGPKPAIISEQEIDRIKKLCVFEGKVNIEYECLEYGKKVEICEGALKGLTGFITEVNGNNNIRIQIESLNCFANVVLEYNSVSIKYIS